MLSSVIFYSISTFFLVQDVATEIASLSKQLADGDFSKLKDARETVLNLKAPPALVSSDHSDKKNRARNIVLMFLI